MINYRKAAMFGLDARIALAIFGALSVITGAALHSVLKSTRATSLLAELDEIGKAYDAYFLNVKKEIPVSTTLPPFLKLKELISSTEKGWKGPYLSYTIASDHALMKGNKKILIGEFLDGDWTSTNIGDKDKIVCATGIVGGDCYLWTSFYDIEDFNLVKSLDKKVDGSVDGKTGRVRWFTVPWESKIYYYVFLKFRSPVGK